MKNKLCNAAKTYALVRLELEIRRSSRLSYGRRTARDQARPNRLFTFRHLAKVDICCCCLGWLRIFV